MLKRRIFAFAAALAMASATTASAIGAPETPSSRRGLEPCQVEQYHRCMAVFGDHSYCYAEAEQTIC